MPMHPGGWIDYGKNLAAQAAQAATEPPLEPVEMVPESVLELYAHIEVPEAIPVPGWSLVVTEGAAFHFIPTYGYRLTPEAQEWCDGNLTGEYWFLGEAGHGHSSPGGRAWEMFFTLEQDYIFFKMRWG